MTQQAVDNCPVPHDWIRSLAGHGIFEGVQLVTCVWCGWAEAVK